MSKNINKISRLSQVLSCAIFLVFVLILFLRTSGITYALDDASQKILDLRKQIDALTKQADQYKGTITQKQKEADTLKRQIDILNSQINQLQLRISITTSRISYTRLEIGNLEKEIADALEKIKFKQQAIGELISLSYERDQKSLLAVVLENSRLSDFANQAKQNEDFNNKLLGLLSELKTQKENLEQDKKDLDFKKTDLESLNKKQITQQISLSGSKSNKDYLLVQTKGQEVRYQQLLDDVEKKKEDFFNELKNLENEALKNGSFIVHVTADYVPPKGTKIFSWPYDDFYMTQGYGYTAYAKRGAYGGAPHNGIDLVAGAGTGIRPIADGIILASGFNNGFGNWVAIKHEHSIVSIYGHMRQPSGLVNGTVVSSSSIIGYEGSTGNATGSHLHLSIYKDFFTYINEKNGQLYFNYFEGSFNPLDYL